MQSDSLDEQARLPAAGNPGAADTSPHDRNVVPRSFFPDLWAGSRGIGPGTEAAHDRTRDIGGKRASQPNHRHTSDPHTFSPQFGQVIFNNLVMGFK